MNHCVPDFKIQMDDDDDGKHNGDGTITATIETPKQLSMTTTDNDGAVTTNQK